MTTGTKPKLTRRELRRRNGAPRWVCWAPWWIRAIIQVLIIPIFLFVYLGNGLLEFLKDVQEIPGEIRNFKITDDRINDYLNSGDE